MLFEKLIERRIEIDTTERNMTLAALAPDAVDAVDSAAQQQGTEIVHVDPWVIDEFQIADRALKLMAKPPSEQALKRLRSLIDARERSD